MKDSRLYWALMDVDAQPVDMELMYDEVLDDMYDATNGYFEILRGSRVLKKTDPIAYRVGFSDYTDSIGDLYCEVEVPDGTLYFSIEDIERAKEEEDECAKNKS